MNKYIQYSFFVYLFIINALCFCDNEQLQDIENAIKDKMQQTLHMVAKEWDITPEQLERIIQLTKEEQVLLWNCIGERNHIFGSPKHDRGFPKLLMEKVAQREGVDISNLALRNYSVSYVNNTLGHSDVFAIADYYDDDVSYHQKWSEEGRKWSAIDQKSATNQISFYPLKENPVSGKVKNGHYVYDGLYYQQVIALYPEFHELTQEEQEAMLIHELEHIIQRHCFMQGILYSFISSNKKISIKKIHKSASGQKWKAAREQEANILPAIRHADVAELFVGICDKKDRRLFSHDECSQIRAIHKMHQKAKA